MASREFSTLGYERLTNPMLRIIDRKAFIERKVAEHHYQPPYFREMERLNLEGGTHAGTDAATAGDRSGSLSLDSIERGRGGRYPLDRGLVCGSCAEFAVDPGRDDSDRCRLVAVSGR